MSRIKPRSVGSFVKRIVDGDPQSKVTYVGFQRCLEVFFSSALFRTDMVDEIDLPVRRQYSLEDCYVVEWDCTELVDKEKPPKRVEPYCFNDATEISREGVDEQEEDLADLIGGRRHRGSGAIEGYKSDASSEHWQAEAKQTKAKSVRLTLDVLDKITREARLQHKDPIVHIRFLEVPAGMIAADDWVVLTAECFKRMLVVE